MTNAIPAMLCLRSSESRGFRLATRHGCRSVGTKRSCPYSDCLLVDVNHFRRREAVEMGAAGGGVSADVLAEEVIPQFEVGELFGQADRVEGVAGGAEDRTNL